MSIDKEIKIKNWLVSKGYDMVTHFKPFKVVDLIAEFADAELKEVLKEKSKLNIDNAFLENELKEARELVEKLMYRMDRCRDILQSKPNAGNWGILDTKLDRIKFNKQDKEE